MSKAKYRYGKAGVTILAVILYGRAYMFLKEM